MPEQPSPIDPIHDHVIAEFSKLLEQEPVQETETDEDSSTRSNRFICDDFGFEVHTLPHNDRAASVNVNILIGRVYSRYNRALRWLSHNRASNTVSLTSTSSIRHHRDLFVSCHRISLPQDKEGMTLMVEDILLEIQKINTGLTRWFPQMLDGGTIAGILWDREEDDRNVRILDDPSRYLAWSRDNPEDAFSLNGLGNANIFGWMNRWQEALDWLEHCEATIPSYDRPEGWDIVYWRMRCRCLRETGRWEEMIAAGDALQACLDTEEAPILNTTIRCCALAGMGKYRELLRRVQSSFYDTQASIWYWRMVAHTKLKEFEQSIECLQNYENFTGPDLFAAQFLASELPEE